MRACQSSGCGHHPRAAGRSRRECADRRNRRGAKDRGDGGGTFHRHGGRDCRRPESPAELGDPARFESARALAAYAGVSPRHNQSGKRRPKSSPLTPIGNRRLRQALWMPTLTAVSRSNLWLQAFYRRLVERGKPHKVALIAAMRKLLAAVYFVAKHRRAFVPSMTSIQEP